MADKQLVRWLYIGDCGRRHAGEWKTLQEVAADIAFYQEVDRFEEHFEVRQTVAIVNEQGVALDDDVVDAAIESEVDKIEEARRKAFQDRRMSPPVVEYYEWDGQHWEE